MKLNKVNDERVLFESNKIYRLCFYVLCAGIFLDLMIKFNLWNFGGIQPIYDKITGELISSGKGVNDFPLFIAMGLEALFLFGTFLANIFMLAKKGISFGISDLDIDRFPKKRYSLISLYISSAIAIAAYIIRVIIYIVDGVSSSPNLFAEFIILFLLVLVAFIFTFLIIYLTFYIAFRFAKKNRERMQKE